MNKFNVPIVLFLFKRKDTLKSIVSQIRKIKPKKIYLIADGPRNSNEINEVLECRKEIEKLIDWECNIIKNYSDDNRGVYNNIANGAKWVFEREKMAIFLEDDNYPDDSFFQYCDEMLKIYKNNEKILWICGTNYLGRTDYQYDYYFTKCLLPCGWASWSDKFLKYYDGDLKGFKDKNKIYKFKKSFKNRRLFKQEMRLIRNEYKRICSNIKPISWDYQMEFSVRSNDMYGISPKYNLIKNIGVDSCSIHGGNDISNIMTKRFCEVETNSLKFPLVHNPNICVDEKYEKAISNIILYPFKYRLKYAMLRFIRKLFNIPSNITTKEYFNLKR